MCCDECRGMLHEYASEKLSELECRSVEKHIKSCGRCRRELEEIKELREFFRSGSKEELIPPADLEAGIMTAINLKKYKNSPRELANWGMSFVAAGLILMLINTTPGDSIDISRNEWDNTRKNIAHKVYQPLGVINEGLDRFIDGVTQLDGITGRIGRKKEGGNGNEM